MQDVLSVQGLTTILAFAVMAFGLWIVWHRQKARKQGFGENALKAMGLVVFFPTLIILAITVEKFQSETLAALLGTLAGYIFSNSERKGGDDGKKDDNGGKKGDAKKHDDSGGKNDDK